MSSVVPYTRTESLGPQPRDNSFPRFHMEAVFDQVASDIQARQVWRDEERVEIFLPGNPTTRPVFKVSQEHIERWPNEYAAFKKGLEMALEGTPIEQWPILTKAQVMELKALGFVTVEHIADMNDHAIQRIPMGGRRLKELAQGYLDDGAAQALLSKATADSDRKDERIAELEAKVGELASLLQTTHAELQGMKNAPHPIAGTAPMMLDPVEQARAAGRGAKQENAGASSLDSLPATPRRRGRSRSDAGGEQSQVA